jgi:SAM-dependent methyltransferase
MNCSVPAAVQCPQCAGDLVAANRTLQCVDCGARFPYDDGIVDFVQGDAHTKLDDIDYNEFYRISEPAARSLIGGLQAVAGTLWPASLGRALEVGAGTGGATMGLVALSPFDHLTVTDISLKMLGLCRENLTAAKLWRPDDISLVAYGATKRCFKPGSFDTCIGTAVLHHILDVEAFLSDLSVFMAPRGIAFFLEPCLAFHSALVATLGDIVAALIRDGVPYDDRDVIRVCNWIAETRCNLLRQGDLEFLATREDKHMFEVNRVNALARSAGFAETIAIPASPDPTGVGTVRTYLGQADISAGMLERICNNLPTYGPRHLEQLEVGDQSPSYLLCFRKAGEPAEAVRCFLTVSASCSEISIVGWSYAPYDVRWLVLEHGVRTSRLPIWLPRPDVQAIMNATGAVPPANAICSGVDARVECVNSRWPLTLKLYAVGGDGGRNALGDVVLDSPGAKVDLIR